MGSRSVLVTGASRGLGSEIAKALLADGFRVIGASRTATATVEELRNQFPEHFIWEPVDLERTAQLAGWCHDLVSRHGRIWGLVNNAAIGLDGLLTLLPEESIRTIFEVNLTAPILLSKYFSRGMLIEREGRIVNISSVAAMTGYTGLSVYSAAKAGMIGFTRSLARELGRAGVCVNAVCPGFLETEMTQSLQGEKRNAIERRSALGRLAHVQDVAGMVRLLMGPHGASITGSVMTVDAGGSC